MEKNGELLKISYSTEDKYLISENKVFSCQAMFLADVICTILVSTFLSLEFIHFVFRHLQCYLFVLWQRKCVFQPHATWTTFCGVLHTSVQ